MARRHLGARLDSRVTCAVARSARIRTARLLLGALLLAAGGAARYLEAAREAVAPVPLRVGETGYSTAIPTTSFPASRLAVRAGGGTGVLPPLARTRGPPGRPASDRALDPVRLRAGGDPGRRPRRPGQRAGVPLGLFRVSGAAKPAAAELRTIFSGGEADGFNGGFGMPCATEKGAGTRAVADPEGVECGVRARQADRADGPRLGSDRRGRHRDRTRRRLRDRPARSGRSPGRSIRGDGVRARRRKVRRGRLALRWFSAEGRAVGGVQSETVPCGTRGWRRLRANGVAPSGTAYVGLYLRAAGTVGHA